MPTVASFTMSNCISINCILCEGVKLSKRIFQKQLSYKEGKAALLSDKIHIDTVCG